MEQNSTIICPNCGQQSSVKTKTVVDHFLSKESFDLRKCDGCHLVFTAPRPAIEKIGSYYQSEEYVSHSSTKKGLINRVYCIVRNYTLNQKVSLVQRHSIGMVLLDIGAGTGHFLKKAADYGFEVTGLEPDETARKVAKLENKLELKDLSDLYELKQNSVDVITMWHVLEHVYDLKKDTTWMSQLIKSDGLWVIAVPNYTSYDAQYYKEHWAAYDVPRHLYHFEPATIIPMIENLGFDLLEMLPMKFDAYYVSMLSEKYKGGNLLNAMRIGLLSNWRSKNGKCSSQIYVFRKKTSI